VNPGDLCRSAAGSLSLHRELGWSKPGSADDINDGNPLVGLMRPDDVGIIVAMTHFEHWDWSLVLSGVVLGWRETSYLRSA